MGTSISLMGPRILKLDTEPGAWFWEVFWAPPLGTYGLSENV